MRSNQHWTHFADERAVSACRAGFPACWFTGLSSPVFRRAPGKPADRYVYCERRFNVAKSRVPSLFPTEEGGEGRGEEEHIENFPKKPLSPALSPLVPRGAREKNALRISYPE